MFFRELHLHFNLPEKDGKQWNMLFLWNNVELFTVFINMNVSLSAVRYYKYVQQCQAWYRSHKMGNPIL